MNKFVEIACKVNDCQEVAEVLYFCIALFVLSVVLGLPKVKGFFGESTVKVILSRLDKEKYIVINDLLIPTEQGKTSQIDHVVVSPFGIFVIETKNYKGWIFGNENSQYWTQTIYKRKEKLFNPIWQNRGHIKALKGLLSDFGDLEYISIVAFSNNADLKVDVTSEVTYFARLNKTIKKYQNEVISPQEVEQICQSLLHGNITDRQARRTHVATIREDKVNRARKVKQGTCPKCGGQLVQRKGKYGNFMGCSSYPKCKFVLKDAK